MSKSVDWRLKVLAQATLARLPGGRRLHESIRRVTSSSTVTDAALHQDRCDVEHHLQSLERHAGISRYDARCFEFGAGWDLAVPLLMAGAGVPAQTVADIEHLARDELLADVGGRIGLSIRSVSDLASAGITYLAPIDVTNTGLPAHSFDLVTSTNTLEHIPEPVLPSLLRECRRLLKAGGICSFRIDYGDHYHYFDPRVSQFNFLRFSERVWHWINSPLHFQNRLRHSEYLDLFSDAGFVVLEEDAWQPQLDQIAALRETPIAHRWRGFPENELAIVGARLVLGSRV